MPTQTPQRMAQGVPVRRAPGPAAILPTPHSHQPHLSRQLASQNMEKRIEQDEGLRKSKVPTDKNIPEGIENIIVGDGVAQYKQMREVERRLDAIMTRKRLQALDPNVRPAGARRYRKLRVWISNTVENQPWQGGGEMDEAQFDFDTGIEATYKVKIEGRLVPDEVDESYSAKKKKKTNLNGGMEEGPKIDRQQPPDGADEGHTAHGERNISSKDDMEEDAKSNEKESPDEGDENYNIERKTKTTSHDEMEKDPNSDEQRSSPPSHVRMSHILSQITIDFDRSKSLQPEAMTAVEWKKPLKDPKTPLPQAADFDCLEFERKGDENMNCTINLYRDEEPQRYTLSDELADIVVSKEDDRASILMKIWEYVKFMGLQQEEDRRMIRCDERLKACFHKDTVFFPELSDRILPHLSAPAPISLAYTIRVDAEFHATPLPTIYDVLVPAPYDPPAAAFQPSRKDLKVIANLDSAIPEVVQALQHSKAKHSFLMSMARDPTSFMKKWINSQRRDMEIMLGDEQQQSETWKKGGSQGIWGSEQVRESVGLLVQRESR